MGEKVRETAPSDKLLTTGGLCGKIVTKNLGSPVDYWDNPRYNKCRYHERRLGYV